MRKHCFLGLIALFAACSDEDANRSGGPDVSGVSSAPLVIVTERAGLDDNSLQYLHLIADWSDLTELDYGRAIEIESGAVVSAQAGAVFVYEPEAGTVQKYVQGEQGSLEPSDKLSFAAHGIMGYNPEPIWVSREVAFMLDEDSAQIARWNPAEMTIDEVTDVSEDVLERDGLKVQFQQGIAQGERLFTAVNWRDWEAFESVPGVALGIFEQDDPASGPTILHDERCAPSVAVNPFADERGNVYVVGDGGLGFDVFASPNKTALPQCVLRVKPGSDELDPDFFVDLQEATGSPGIYTVHPMADHNLLVNAWSSDVAVEDVADPEDPSWYWSYPPYFEHVIVDLETGRSTHVEALPRGGVQFSKTLRVADQSFVQLYREDGGSVLYRVDPDATVTQLLESPAGTDVQYLGRL